MVERFYVDDLFDDDFLLENNDVTVVQAREILKLVTNFDNDDNIKREINFKTLSIAVYNKMFIIKNDVQAGKIVVEDDDNIFNIKNLKIVQGVKEIFNIAIEDLVSIEVSYFDKVDTYKLAFKVDLEDTLISMHIRF